jgi:hypothetical protein
VIVEKSEAAGRIDKVIVFVILTLAGELVVS